MKLVTIDTPSGGRLGAQFLDEILDLQAASGLEPLADWLPTSTTRLIRAGGEGFAVVRRQLAKLASISDDERESLRQKGLLTPLASTALRAPAQPSFVFCMGRAYNSHRQEMMGDARAARERAAPTGFIKNVHAITGPYNPICLPPAAPDMVDFEGEIAVVFNRRCHAVSPQEAMVHVLGFTVVNDVSARNWIDAGDDLNRMGKQFPTFLPMGPCIATIDEFDDPENLHFETRLNGEVMQDARTSDLVWSIPEIIAYFSRWYTFAAGDVLSTGTCGGVGVARNPKVFLKDGDRVTVTVDGVGAISNPVTSSWRIFEPSPRIFRVHNL